MDYRRREWFDRWQPPGLPLRGLDRILRRGRGGERAGSASPSCPTTHRHSDPTTNLDVHSSPPRQCSRCGQMLAGTTRCERHTLADLTVPQPLPSASTSTYRWVDPNRGCRERGPGWGTAGHWEGLSAA